MSDAFGSRTGLATGVMIMMASVIPLHGTLRALEQLR